MSSSRRLLQTCGKPSCSYELRARSTRGNVYGNVGGGPTRKEVVGYEAAHRRARRDLPDEGCALADETCTGRLEVALRADAPREYLHTDARRGIIYYSGPNSSDGYRRLCRSHHAREGSTLQVLARITDRDLAARVAEDLGVDMTRKRVAT